MSEIMYLKIANAFLKITILGQTNVLQWSFNLKQYLGTLEDDRKFEYLNFDISKMTRV